jgi:hypothetical protein
VYWYKGVECYNDPLNMALGAVMYMSYLGLFVHFALQKYVWGGGKKKHAAKSSAAAAKKAEGDIPKKSLAKKQEKETASEKERADTPEKTAVRARKTAPETPTRKSSRLQKLRD